MPYHSLTLEHTVCHPMNSSRASRGRGAGITGIPFVRSLGTPLSLLLLLCFTTGTARAQIAIDSIEELQLIGNDPAYPLDGSYVLTQDIDATATATWNDGAGFVPIGSLLFPFTGAFNGQGHVIEGLTINRPEEWNVGLFGYITDSAEVRNLGTEGGSVSGYGTCGGLVGRNLGTVENCHSTAEVAHSGDAGGLVGYNSGTVSNCYATGAVWGTAASGNIGGLVGDNDGMVTSCYATGAASGTQLIGGLVGFNYYGTIENCYSTGAVWGQQSPGGLVGSNNGGTVANCYSTGTVEISGAGLSGSAGAVASFWDMDTSQATWSNGGTGLTTAQMQTLSTYTDAGWDFVNVWGMEPGEYPHLLMGKLQMHAQSRTEEWATPGGQVEFRVTPGGSGSYTYQWYKGTPGAKAAVAIDGAISDTLVFDSATLDDTGSYFCAISDADETIYSSVFELTVAELPAAGPAALLSLCALVLAGFSVAARRRSVIRQR